MIRLATVLPCFNEEDVLRSTVERLTGLYDRMKSDGRISADSMMMFVDDGSGDGTWQLIKQLYKENEYVKGIRLTRNRGHQIAIMAGMMTAKGVADAVITVDADLQDDIECIPRMVECFEAGYDIVYGVKVKRKADSLVKRLTAQAFYRFQSAMGVEGLVNHADFRLLSRRALEMLSCYKEYNLYLRGLIPLIGLPWTTVEDVISERSAGRSKYTMRRMLHLAADGITAFSARPMHAIFYLGLMFLLVALGIGVYVIHALVTGTAVPGWASLMLSVWLVGGFIILSIGVAGMYISNIYNEVKRRPLYHIQDILE